MVIITVHGNLESLKDSLINEIESLYDLEFDRSEFVPSLLAEKLAELTSRVKREIAVYLDRKGNVVEISVGGNSTVPLPEVAGKRSRSRLSGIRCIHTHPNGDGRLSAVDLSSLTGLRLDAMTALGIRDGKIVNIYAALAERDEKGEFSKYQVYGPYENFQEMDSLLQLVIEQEKNGGELLFENEAEQERAILVGLDTGTGDVIDGKSEGERSLEELGELAKTAGAVVVYKMLQKRPAKDPAFLIGKGKLEELNLIRQSLNANVVIFDEELSGAQVRNIEEVVGVKVIDRTTLILDIFAQRARSREGRLQVELAQLKYRLPRLMGLGTALSRLGAGIGTRGPGEKKLEIDRRHISRRIGYLEHELKVIEKRRNLLREGRKRNVNPTIALVGYTNAGKSSLMNRLCNSNVFVEDKLFATLDPTARKLVLPDGREVLLVDTVGFIRKLPHELVDAFKSTLEEVVYADVLLHVVDCSDSEAETKMKVGSKLLQELGAANKPVLLVLNKIDLVDRSERLPFTVPGNSVFEVSAETGEGLDRLLEAIARIVPRQRIEVNLLAPYSEGWILSFVHENGEVLSSECTEEGIKIRAYIDRIKAERLKDYVVNGAVT